MSRGFTHESTYNESKEWYTPRYIFDALGVKFDLDPCSPGADVVPWVPAVNHYTIKDNGLIQPWNGRVFMNPPYGMDTPKWFAKLANHGNGIGLVFARTDTGWFHRYVSQADAICFIHGRVQFVPNIKAKDYSVGQYNPARDYWIDPQTGKKKKGGCGAASMLVAYGRENAGKLYLSNLGLCVKIW